MLLFSFAMYLFLVCEIHFRSGLCTHKHTHGGNVLIPCLVKPGHTFQKRGRILSLWLRDIFFSFSFFIKSAALNYKIFPRNVAVVPGLQLVSGITDARLERRTFIRLKETAHPVFVDFIFSSGNRNRNSAFLKCVWGALAYSVLVHCHR